MSTKSKATRPAWLKTTRQYERTDHRKAFWQLANTFIPYIALWYLMIRTIHLGYSYLLTLTLAVLAANFLVRFLSFSTTVAMAPFSPRGRRAPSWDTSPGS